MKTTDAGSVNPIHIDANKAARESVKHPDPAATTRTSEGTRDKVTLTNEARQIQNMQDQLHSQPDVDAGRVAALKAAIADGSYQVDSSNIAENLLALSQDLKG